MTNLKKIALIKIIGEIMTKPDQFDKDLKITSIGWQTEGELHVSVLLKGRLNEFGRELLQDEQRRP